MAHNFTRGRRTLAASASAAAAAVALAVSRRLVTCTCTVAASTMCACTRALLLRLSFVVDIVQTPDFTLDVVEFW